MLVVGQHRVACRRRGSCGTRRRAGRGSPAGCARAARCGNARPWHARRRAAPRSGRSRPRARSAGRSPTTRSSGRRPSPRTRTCWRGRCRIRRPPRRWSRPRRSACATAPSSPSRSTSQARAEAALVIVSWVVKVFEATMNSVRAGSRPASVSARCAPSTLETKCGLRSGALVGLERLADHQRAEVGAADADVDDVGDGRAGVAAPARRRGPAR